MSDNDASWTPPPSPPDPSSFGGAPVFQLATWVQRVVAYFIDSAIYAAILMVGFMFSGGGENQLVSNLGWLAGMGFWFWNLYQQGETGSTIGKKLTGLRLVYEENAQHVGGMYSILRGICHFLDAIPCWIGFFWPLWDPKRQTFADKLLKTVVVTR